MSFTVFSDGNVLFGCQLNNNSESIIYSVLYNTMRADANALTQIDPSIQSDQFCDADGRYNTVCTGATDSFFNTNFYSPFCVCTTIPFSLGICCISGAHACVSGCLSNNVYVRAHCDSDACVCYTHSHASVFGDVYCILATVSICGHLMDTYTYFNVCANFSSDVLAVSDSIGGSGNLCCCTCSANYCFIRNGVYLDFYKSGTCICQYTSTDCFCVGYNLFVRNRCHTGDGAIGRINTSISAYYINTVGTIQTVIKNYDIPKNTVMLVNNSVLPSGNCVRYDILNQDGCTYLSDAEPDKVYNLCTNDSCCFYAVIKQCVECNLCNPQCMYGYALKMM